MRLRELYWRFKQGSAGLAVLTLAAGGLFKLAAFAREAFIASRFGLSTVTDAYFAFQQFPLTAATFMFGAFSLAFTPAFAAEKRRNGSVEWLPGVLLYGCSLGLAITALMILFAPQLLHMLAASSPDARSTLVLLAWSFPPVICLGVWTAVTLSYGRNLRVMCVSGLPYLTMTLLLVALYAAGRLNNLSLPLSFLVGFGVFGVCALLALLVNECRVETWRNIWNIAGLPGFRSFLRQLAASSLENLGFATNQLLLIYFVAQTGAGAVSANTCAMRVGMFGLSLIGLPLAQLVQGKLSVLPEREQPGTFRRWFLAISIMVAIFAALLYLLRIPLIGLVYLHGRFSQAELLRVAEVMPAWIGYFVVTSLNALLSRYLFSTGQGNVYLRRQLSAYTAANVARLALLGHLSGAGIVWCSVIAEGCALLLGLKNGFALPLEPLVEHALSGAQEVGL